MAVKKHGVHFDITAENATDRAFKAVESNLKGINAAGEALGRTLQSAFIATAVISAGKAFATAAIEAEQASKRLDAVLKATGHSAGLTKKQLDGMADAMAESTQFDDESLRNAQAQMLKFGNIHGETFGAAMKLSADLAAFMGTDLNSAVQAVGKALTSPTEGLGALERQVGKFNPAAQAMIKNLVEAGNEAKAQAMVLDLLKGKIGGTAEALNTGLGKAASEAKKQWNEMLEAIGKTEAFQKAGKSGLNFIEQSFRDIKSIIEDGDWVEKTLAIMAFAGGMRGMKLTPGGGGGEGGQEAKGRIRGLPSATVMDDELAGAPMSERDQKAFKDMLALQEKAREERKRLAEAQIRDDEQVARRVVEIDEETQRTITEAQEAWQRQRAEREKQAAEDSAAMWKQVFEQIDREQEDAIEHGRILMEGMKDETKDASAAARELGLVFSSAFEDAVIGGKKFKDVLKGLAQDLLRMGLRKMVTEPLADWATGVFKGAMGSGSSGGAGGLGGGIDFVKGFFGFEAGGIMGPGGPVPLRRYAGGGVADSPQLAMFGEGSQSEAFVPLPDGRSIPVSMKGGGGLSVVINAPGADAAQLRRVEAALVELHSTFDQRAVGAVTRRWNSYGMSTP